MKATGIVRRVDDLGRVVIPREIRRSMGIEDGEPLEIFVDDNKVIFQKYQKSVDWERAWSIIYPIIPSGIAFTLYDVNGQRVAGNKIMFPQSIKDIILPQQCYTCTNNIGNTIGYIAADSDKVNWELVEKVLRAFIEG